MKAKHLVPGVVAAGLLALPLWPDAPGATNRKLEEGLDELARRVERLEERSRTQEAKQINGEAVVDEVVRKLARIEPKESVWLELEMGRGHKWLFDTGEQATMEFVGFDGGGDTPTFRVVHKTLDTRVALRAGESIRAVDDRGTERRVYTSTLHALHRDRTGVPRRALLSVAFAIEPVL